MNSLRLSRKPRLSARRCVLLAALGLVGALGLSPCARAHTDLLVQIDQLTKQIGDAPQEASLYVRRGELRRLHVEYDAAFADFEKAAALSPQLEFLDLSRGRLFLEAGWPLSARNFLDRFLTRFPTNADALVLRARVLAKLEKRLEAARDYDQAIRVSREPGPDLFIERAESLAAAGPEQLAAAVRGLDEGIQRLGPLVTLQLYAIDIDLRRKEYDSALARLKQVAAKSPRQETWLARRGEILLQAGRTNDARASFKAALDAFESLPPTRRNVPAMLELERRIRRELNPEPAVSGKTETNGGGPGRSGGKPLP